MDEEGLFSEADLTAVRDPGFISPRCGSCGLAGGCKSPKMSPSGAGQKRIVVVGEAPGETEDETGRQFQGKAGQRLQRVLRSVGCDLFHDCVVTNALSCRPPGNKIPKEVMIEYCRPLVMRAVEQHKPNTIILLGTAAVRSVLGTLWREDPGGVGRWRGFRIPSVRWNAWVCPAYHPSYLERMGDNPDPVADNEFRDDMAAAVRTAAARPYRTVPDPRRLVTVVNSPSEAVGHIKEFFRNGRPVAFDFETDRLKPHSPDSYIACCSISDGRTTVAYPWTGPAVDATRILLTEPSIPKIGANVKFEQGWCMSNLGIRVAGWKWDVVTTAHSLDARPGITSVKFQAFVRFGVEDWGAHVHPYLTGTGGNGPNRVRSVDAYSLLLYCGMDSLLEYKIAQQQAKELGVEL